MSGTIERQVAELLAAQPLGVLCTRGARLHASLIAIASSQDLRTILFATARDTEKFNNLATDPEAAFLVHNARGTPEDFQQALALTIQGRAGEVEFAAQKVFDRIYLGRHPSLAPFIAAPTTARMILAVDTYRLVRRFEQVQILRFDQ